MTLIADVFRKLRTQKNVVIWISEKSHLQDPSETSMVSGPKHCLTSKFIKRAFFVSFSVQNTWLVLCFLLFIF